MNRNIIKKRIDRVIKSESWKNYDDLHIDIIFSKKEVGNQQLLKGIEVLEVARELLPNSYRLVLGVSLKTENKKTDWRFKKLNEIEKEIDWTSPSLYLFKSNNSEWIEVLKKCTLYKLEDTSADCYYFDIKMEDYDEIEFRRGVYIELK